jgi:hypothetical protein
MANATNQGLSVSSTSNLSNGQKVIIESGRLAFEPAAPDPDLVDNFTMPNGHKSWELLTWARLAQASALAEGIDLAQTEQLYANQKTVTPTEHGIIATVSKRLVDRQGDRDVVSTAGVQLAGSLRRRQASDIISLYDGFSKSVVGAGNALDITYFRGSVAYLLTDNDSEYGPAPLPLRAAMHIEGVSDLILDISDPRSAGDAVSDRNGMSAEMLKRWWKGSDRLYGVEVFHSGLIARDANDDAKGALFAQEALAMVKGSEAEPTEEKDNSLRAFEYGLFMVWGETEVSDPYGVEVFHDAAATV